MQSASIRTCYHPYQRAPRSVIHPTVRDRAEGSIPLCCLSSSSVVFNLPRIHIKTNVKQDHSTSCTVIGWSVLFQRFPLSAFASPSGGSVPQQTPHLGGSTSNVTCCLHTPDLWAALRYSNRPHGHGCLAWSFTSQTHASSRSGHSNTRTPPSEAQRTPRRST